MLMERKSRTREASTALVLAPAGQTVFKPVHSSSVVARCGFGSPIGRKITNDEAMALVKRIWGKLAETRKGDSASLQENTKKFADLLRELALQNPHCELSVTAGIYQEGNFGRLIDPAIITMAVKNVNPVNSDHFIFTFTHLNEGVMTSHYAHFEFGSSGSTTLLTPVKYEHTLKWMQECALKAMHFDPSNVGPSYLYVHALVY